MSKTISWETSLRERMKDPEFAKAYNDMANEDILECEPITLSERFWDLVANVQLTLWHIVDGIKSLLKP